MTKPRGLLAICATISLLFVLALVFSASASHSSVLKSTGASGNLVADGPIPPDDDDVGNVLIADGPIPPDDDDVGNVLIADGPIPPDDDDVGNVLIADGPIPPDDDDVGNVAIAAISSV